jgi:hypothetical protein
LTKQRKLKFGFLPKSKNAFEIETAMKPWAGRQIWNQNHEQVDQRTYQYREYWIIEIDPYNFIRLNYSWWIDWLRIVIVDRYPKPGIWIQTPIWL